MDKFVIDKNKFDVDENLESPFNFAHLKRSFVYIKKHTHMMILAFALSALAVLCSLTAPYIMKIVMDQSVPNKDIKQLVWLSAILGGTIVLSVIFTTIRSRIMAKVGQKIIFDIRQDLFDHLQQLPFSYYDNRPHGKILVRVVQYVNNVSDLLSNGIINLFLELFSLIFIIVFMFLVDTKLTLVIISGLPILILIMIAIKPQQRHAMQGFSNKSSNLNAYLHESINGIRVTQIFAREQVNKGIFTRLSEDVRNVWMTVIYVSNLVWVSVDLISQIVFSFVYVSGIYWAGGIVISFGTILAMGNYASRFWQPITNIANIYNNFINTISYLERIFETIDEPVTITDVEGATELPVIKGTVEFKDVVFGYEEGITVLHDTNFKVNAGESIALVGPTGSGKSTIINLISRFYDLTGGVILIDDNDISQVTLHSLRKQMGIMLQDSFMFSGNIMENIRYGRLNATDEEIIEASKTVHADDFISQMQLGYFTEINERGSRLSQGQKQLISFARTLIADPKILILDEATSSIDTNTERLVQEGLRGLLRGRTSFIIAHRLSTIKDCNRIMYIDDGRIIETGTHAELLDKKGAYYNLYMSQLSE